MMAAIMMRGCSVQRTPFRHPCWLATRLTCFQTSGVRNSRIEPESDSERFVRRFANLADAREEEAEHCAAMGPSLFPWGSWKEPRHDDKRRSHVLGQFPQGRPTPSPYQTTTPGTSNPKSSSALGAPTISAGYWTSDSTPGTFDHHDAGSVDVRPGQGIASQCGVSEHGTAESRGGRGRG